MHPEPGDAERILQTVFGYDAFRGVQARVVDQVVSVGNALVLMPTGGGKSLCYQVPGLVREGVAVVVSPLISLMQDQVQALQRKGVAAVAISSAMNAREMAAAERAILSGQVRFAYASPERLANPRFMDVLDRARIALFSLDEAHCVSQWGHDFRPEYLEVGAVADRFPDVPRLALTATASPQTRQEIIERFKLAGAPVFVSSFDRPNHRVRHGHR
jgi:ATP-dependent DNA helicase RecQ